jgi:hypothetical protein
MMFISMAVHVGKLQVELQRLQSINDTRLYVSFGEECMSGPANLGIKCGFHSVDKAFSAAHYQDRAWILG